jgi:hypothetical protein
MRLLDVKKCFDRSESIFSSLFASESNGTDENRASLPGLPDGIHICLPEIQIWVNFGGNCNGRCWHILRPFGLFCGHFVYFTEICYFLYPFGIFYIHLVFSISILYSCGIFSPVLVYCTKKNLAILQPTKCGAKNNSGLFGAIQVVRAYVIVLQGKTTTRAGLQSAIWHG